MVDEQVLAILRSSLSNQMLQQSIARHPDPILQLTLLSSCVSALCFLPG